MRVLRRIFGPNREEVMRGRGTLHNVKLHNVYFPPNILLPLISVTRSGEESV
jgi:hypothetical protein